MNLFTKQKKTHKLRERTYGKKKKKKGCQERTGGRDIVREFGIDIYTLLYLNG